MAFDLVLRNARLANSDGATVDIAVAEGRIAASSLFRSPTRTGVTAAAVALVLTIGVTVSSLSYSHRRSVERYFNGSVSRVGSSVLLDVPSSVTIDSAPRSIGCAYYEAGLAELLRLLINGGGAVDHVRCIARGEGTCSWRAEWRPLN